MKGESLEEFLFHEARAKRGGMAVRLYAVALRFFGEGAQPLLLREIGETVASEQSDRRGEAR